MAICNQPLRVLFEDAAVFVHNAKTYADIAARQLATDEYQRTTSSLRRQQKKIISATSDTERDIREIKTPSGSANFISRLCRTPSATPLQLYPRKTSNIKPFLKGLHPATMQPPATPPHAVQPASKPAAVPPPAPDPSVVLMRQHMLLYSLRRWVYTQPTPP